MKTLSSGLKIFFWIILIISFDIKSDISVKDLDLKEVFKSGRSLMSLDNGLHYLEEELDIQNVLFIGVHGSDSEGYEWIYPLITINDNQNLMSFFRYNDNLCPNRAYANLSNDINRLLTEDYYLGTPGSKLFYRTTTKETQEKYHYSECQKKILNGDQLRIESCVSSYWLKAKSL